MIELLPLLALLGYAGWAVSRKKAGGGLGLWIVPDGYADPDRKEEQVQALYTRMVKVDEANEKKRRSQVATKVSWVYRSGKGRGPRTRYDAKLDRDVKIPYVIEEDAEDRWERIRLAEKYGDALVEWLQGGNQTPTGFLNDYWASRMVLGRFQLTSHQMHPPTNQCVMFIGEKQEVADYAPNKTFDLLDKCKPVTAQYTEWHWVEPDGTRGYMQASVHQSGSKKWVDFEFDFKGLNPSDFREYLVQLASWGNRFGWFLDPETEREDKRIQSAADGCFAPSAGIMQESERAYCETMQDDTRNEALLKQKTAAALRRCTRNRESEVALLVANPSSKETKNPWLVLSLGNMDLERLAGGYSSTDFPSGITGVIVKVYRDSCSLSNSRRAIPVTTQQGELLGSALQIRPSPEKFPGVMRLTDQAMSNGAIQKMVKTGGVTVREFSAYAKKLEQQAREHYRRVDEAQKSQPAGESSYAKLDKTVWVEDRPEWPAPKEFEWVATPSWDRRDRALLSYSTGRSTEVAGGGFGAGSWVELRQAGGSPRMYDRALLPTALKRLRKDVAEYLPKARGKK